MATIVMADFDFDDCDFERKMVEAAGIQFKSFDDARNRTPAEIIEPVLSWMSAKGYVTKSVSYDESDGSFTIS